MFDVHKHPTILADATRAYVKATSSSVRFLIAENERMAKELQTAKQGGELVKRAESGPPFLFSLTSQIGKNTRQSFHILRVRKERKGDSS